MKLINTDTYTLASRLDRLASGRHHRRRRDAANNNHPKGNTPQGTTPKKAA